MKTSLRFVIALTFLLPLLAPNIHAATTLRISQSQISPDTRYEIIFDRAVIEDKQINQVVDNTIMTITPPIPGKIRWKASNIANFIPSAPPTMGTTYKFTLNKGLTDRDGKEVPSTLLKTAKSESFTVGRSSRRSSSLSYTRQPVYYVSFNDAISADNAARYFVFKNNAGVMVAAHVRQATWGDIKSRYYRGSSWQERFQAAKSGKPLSYSTEASAKISNALIVSATNPLPVGNGWYLHVLASIPNAQNTASVKLGRNISIGNVEPFEVQAITPEVSANKPREIIVKFNSKLPKELSEEQLRAMIITKPEIKNATYKTLGTSVIVKGDLRLQDKWDVTVNPSISSANGLMLAKAVTKSIEFKTLHSGLALPAFDSAQYSNGNRRYAIDTVNISSVRIRVKQLTPENAIRTMQGYRHYTGNGHNNSEINPEAPLPYSLVNGETVYDRTIFLDNKIDTTQEVDLNWNDILPKDQNTTTFFISVEGTTKDEAQGEDRISQSFVQLTDIGLCWKLSETEAFVYAFSCLTGKPLGNVDLQVFNEDAEKADITKTDANGIARIPRNKAARHLRATRGKDCYIIPFDNTLDTIDLWRFPVDITWNHVKGWKRTATMFTDRNLYRPGETVHLKGVARRYLDNQIEFTADKTAQLIISDNSSRVLVDREVSLSSNGSFDYTMKLPAETVGRFTAKLVFPEANKDSDDDSWVSDRHRIFHHQFNVQEFRRNAYEVTSNIETTNPGAKSIVLNLDAQYYQGQPVKNGTLEWYFDSTQTGFYPDKYRDYLFGDHRKYDSWYWSHYFGYSGDNTHRGSSDRNGTGQLDDNGKTAISFELPELTFPTAMAVKLHSEITDSRDQTLTTIAKTTVHPADTYVGISRVDRLIRVGEEPQLELIAVDTDGEQRDNAVTVTAVIEREYHESIKVQSADGKVSVKNNKKTEIVSEQTITIQANTPTTLPFTPAHAGRHIVTLKGTDQNGHDFSTASSMWIYGTNSYPWASEDGMKIKLVPEKKLYNPGDTARVLVMTPIEGTAIVTVERSGVHREYRRELKADNPVIEFPLTDMDAPNAYVSVIVIRGSADSPRKHKEPVLKLGYCTLNVNNVKDKLEVELEVLGSQHRPSEITEVTGTVTLHDGSPAAGAEVVFYAEDEGTLAVAGYQTPNLMNFFHAPRPLLVQCGTSFSTFIAENSDNRHFANKGFTIGGGEAEGLASEIGADEVKLRTNFDPCAVWQPSVTTDAEGKFKVAINNPDTLTRYRVMAVALSGAKKFGHQTTEYTVNKPLMLEPAAPRYASEGDKLSPKVLVQNNSKYEGTWEISLITDGITIPSSNSPADSAQNTMSKSITLKPGDAATVYFDVTFVNTGTTSWIWSATPVKLTSSETLTPVLAKELSDKAETKFEVTYPMPTMRQVQFISMNNNRSNNLLNGVRPELLNGRGHVDLEFSNSLLLEAAGANDFLLHYPYGCLEQTTSSLMPWFAARDLKGVVPSFTNKTEAEVSKAIQIGVDRLLSMQTSDGGLGYWPGATKSTTWASAYGGMGLILAQRNGAHVPNRAIEKITTWMAELVKQDLAKSNDQSHYWNNEIYARTLYVLALAGKPEVALQNKMLDNKKSLSPTATSFLALAIHASDNSDTNRATAISLLNNITERQETKHWMRYNSDHAMKVLAWSEIDPENEQVHKSMKAMLGNRNPYGNWRTTWNNSWAIQAMASYARNVEKDRKPSTLQIVTNGETKTLTLDQDNPTQTLRIPLQEGLQLAATSNGITHTNIKVSAKPALAPTGPRGYSGMSILRRYERMLTDGTTQPLGQPQVGDLVKVSLDITFPTILEYVVIEDRLPSLFEAVNNDFASQSSRFKGNSDYEWSINHKELRSDRACFFVNRSWHGGTRTVSYLARVTSAGIATAPAAKVECMYDPVQIALSDSNKLTTKKKETIVTK